MEEHKRTSKEEASPRFNEVNPSSASAVTAREELNQELRKVIAQMTGKNRNESPSAETNTVYTRI